MSDAAVPLSKKYSPQSRLVPDKIKVIVNIKDSLVTLCRRTIVNHLERFPPLAFGILDASEWDELVALKHKNSQPKKGTGGIDGTGRIAPAIKHEFMSHVEEANPSFAESETTDRLVWRDCTEFRFRKSGLTRPDACRLPFPMLVEDIRRQGELLQSAIVRQETGNEADIKRISQFIFNAPMSVHLLKETGIGKVLRTILKKHRVALAKPEAQVLESVLSAWKTLAANEGVAMKKSTPGRSSLEEKWAEKQAKCRDDFQKVESCMSWRQLFAYLMERADKSKSSQGKRMREIRKNLAKGRPQVVKVRTANARQSGILAGSRASFLSSGGANSGNKKVNQLRSEASITTGRRASASPVKKITGSRFGNGFAAGVAFSSVSKKSGSTKRLGDGKILKMPPKKTRRTGR